jgi:hypothetical protein
MSAATVARKPLVYIAGAAAAVIVLLILITVSSAPSSVTINGTYDLDAGYVSGGCAGTGDYIDVFDGTPVWVFDEPGHPIASSKLILEDQGMSTCHFTFSVASGSTPSWVQVGDQAKVRIVDVGGLVALRSGPPRQP